MLVTSTIQTRPREILPTSQGRDAAAEEQQGAEAESGGSAAARMPVRGAEEDTTIRHILEGSHGRRNSR